MSRHVVDRLACVNVAALPLQLLLRAHPDWIAAPTAVVEADRPQALVRYVNAPAARAGVRAGHRYATALAITRVLRAGTIPSAQVTREVGALTERLRRFSPRVEPSTDRPGVFWLDVQGLDRLYPALLTWADDVRIDLRNTGLIASIAIGFSRFGTYALARAQPDVTVCADAEGEHARVGDVPLAHLDLDPGVRDRLRTLGITTVGGFLRLPAASIRARFGAATDALYQLASGRRWAPLVPAAFDEPHEGTVDFEVPEQNVERLVFVLKRLLDGLAAAAAQRARGIAGVRLHLTLDDHTTRTEGIRPAAATLDVAQLLTLVRLRFDTLQLSAGVVTLRMELETCTATAEGRRLFSTHLQRETDAANQAFARLRAECGEQSVVRARLCEAHLPNARFVWEPLERVPLRSTPNIVIEPPLVRRIFEQAVPWDEESDLEPTPPLGDLSSQHDSHVPAPSWGPYRLSGAWWGGGVCRDYYFVHTNDGDLRWIYYDHKRKRVFLQGRVE
jgi:protein ImuB